MWKVNSTTQKIAQKLNFTIKNENKRKLYTVKKTEIDAKLREKRSARWNPRCVRVWLVCWCLLVIQMRMMLYPEEHFWTVPTFHGLYDDNDYNGKIIYIQLKINGQLIVKQVSFIALQWIASHIFCTFCHFYSTIYTFFAMLVCPAGSMTIELTAWSEIEQRLLSSHFIVH